ncbi:MAG: ATPase domain-containing protein [Armatimonadota bacterium]
MGDLSIERIPTGVAGLDVILEGGLVARQAYLVRGEMGAGKTTLGLHFLTEGARHGESVLFITMLKREAEVRLHAASMGFDLHGVHLLDISPAPELFSEMQTSHIFTPAEVERGPLMQKIMAQIQASRPQRICVDAITQLRYLATDEFEFRRLTLAFLRFLQGQNATVLFTAEMNGTVSDASLQFLSDGVITLNKTAEGRTIEVEKLLGSSFHPGHHSLRLYETGITVYPQLVVPEHPMQPFTGEIIPSGVPALDALLDGGIERGLVTIISGPSGTGKSLLSLLFTKEAATRGERSAIFLFEETRDPLLKRAERLGLPLEQMLAQGRLSVTQVMPTRYLPDELTALVCREVEEHGARVVVIDSLAGYQKTLHGEEFSSSVFDLCTYLKAWGVTTLLINDVEAITGDFRVTELHISYLADNIIFLRYLEMRGALHKAIGVLKKRMSHFEQTLREFVITDQGFEVGDPLVDLRGILLGVPEWVGPSKERET